MRITYTGPTGTITQVPFYQALAGETDSEDFRDKIVIVGATAPGLYDIRPAPYRSSGRHFLGVETNANIVDTLLRTGARTNASFSYAWAVFALALGLAIGWTAWSFGEALGPIIGALMLGLIALLLRGVQLHVYHHAIRRAAAVWGDTAGGRHPRQVGRGQARGAGPVLGVCVPRCAARVEQ
jgi:CHASE2 domain-containing sensor protein